jgi:uncharacterized membrane protein
LLLMWPGQWRHVRTLKAPSATWFVASGVFAGLSQMFIYMAFAIAPVSVVTPILQLQLMFRYLFAKLLNPRHEVFGGPVIAGTAASLLGALALSLDTEFVLGWLGLPDPIAAAARWQWP